MSKEQSAPQTKPTPEATPRAAEQPPEQEYQSARPRSLAGQSPATPPPLLGGGDLRTLQRTLGNRATAHALQRRQQRVTAPAIQRTMYLSNADDNIYKDADDATNEYAYITKGQVPFFIEYPNVAKLQSNAAIKHWMANLNARNFQRKIDD